MAPPDEPQKAPAAAALARKRRIALRKQAAVAEEIPDSDDSCNGNKRARIEDVQVDPVTKKPKPSITGIKKKSRYDPGVPMTRNELKEWRKEARRVRNRESAAASRKRNRERIDELESEVDVLKSKYSAALKFIMGLEGGFSSQDLFKPDSLRQDLRAMMPFDQSVPSSPEVRPIVSGYAPVSPTAPFSLISMEDHNDEVQEKQKHIMAMISRPIACVT